ncbi:unnamed protein product [Notodromas monacha]|uniref:Uncharacterized protein n=1 Tax=Notodromas monacha TaxID=399045 RepID=A0A7R9BW91_9CRUS|nr:unnamed protein product [Notodromas monacha]CAG0921277.1 unnamed protein product [Notodromas monacha]
MAACRTIRLLTMASSPTPSPMYDPRFTGNPDTQWGAQCGNSTHLEAATAMQWNYNYRLFETMICCRIQFNVLFFGKANNPAHNKRTTYNLDPQLLAEMAELGEMRKRYRLSVDAVEFVPGQNQHLIRSVAPVIPFGQPLYPHLGDDIRHGAGDNGSEEFARNTVNHHHHHHHHG